MEKGNSPRPSDKQKRKPRFSRRKDGCHTCRQRRVRCVGVKPVCDHCRRLNHTCRWPDIVDFDGKGGRRSSASTLRRETSSLRSSSDPLHASQHESTSPENAGNAPDVQDTLGLLSQLASQDRYSIGNVPSMMLNGGGDSVPAFSSWDLSPTSFKLSGPTCQSQTVPIVQTSLPVTSDTRGLHMAMPDKPPQQPDKGSTSIFGSAVTDHSQLFDSFGDFITNTPDNGLQTNAPVLTQMPHLGDDLNFNFCFGLDPPSTSTTAASISAGIGWDGWNDSLATTCSTAIGYQKRFCLPVTPEPVDQPIIQYFVGSISHIAITRNRTTPNYYLGLFTVSLFCPALYHGMLAWSAWHMAAVSDGTLPGSIELLEYAKKKHQACNDHLFSNLDSVDVNNENELEAVYCSLFVCGQFKVVTCAPTSEVRVVIDAIDNIYRRIGFSSSSSPLLQRMATILSQYDVRSSLFGINRPVFTLRLGADLFDHLKPSAADQASSTGTYSVLHLHYLEAKCNDLERNLREARDRADMTAFRRITRQGDELYEQITTLEDIFDPPRLAHFGAVASYDPVDHASTATALASIDQDTSYEMVLACTFHGIVIHVSRALKYPVPSRSVDRVIGLAFQVTRRNPEVVHSILAIPMFFAAVATTDKAQLDQVMGWINLRSGATSGTIGKTSALLMEVKQSEKEGMVIDIGRLMSQSRYDFLM